MIVITVVIVVVIVIIIVIVIVILVIITITIITIFLIEKMANSLDSLTVLSRQQVDNHEIKIILVVLLSQ
jgi:hypothetical protein